jgi:signal peptidase II
MKKIIIVLTIFAFDRITKLYLINLSENGINVDFQILPFLNFYLVWNTGIGFGLMSLEADIYYHIVTVVIGAINLALIYLLYTVKNNQVYMIALILGGSLGNLLDRIIFFAVPDFIDLHLNNFHWFTFNVADIFISIGILGLIFFEITNKAKYFTNA